MPTATQPVKSVAPARPVEALIRLIRGQKVMLDTDLAELYGVQTKRLNEAVKRSPGRFPANFMFQLSLEERNCLRSQFATSKTSRGGRRYQPYAFTEHGVVMLSSVLNSARAIQMSIIVVNAFVRMRELIAANKDLAARIEKLEHSQDRTVSVIEVLVEDIDRLGEEVKWMKALPEPQKRGIGFL
jgi:phage regulator Rha-like protein